MLDVLADKNGPRRQNNRTKRYPLLPINNKELLYHQAQKTDKKSRKHRLQGIHKNVADLEISSPLLQNDQPNVQHTKMFS